MEFRLLTPNCTTSPGWPLTRRATCTYPSLPGRSSERSLRRADSSRPLPATARPVIAAMGERRHRRSSTVLRAWRSIRRAMSTLRTRATMSYEKCRSRPVTSRRLPATAPPATQATAARRPRRNSTIPRIWRSTRPVISTSRTPITASYGKSQAAIYPRLPGTAPVVTRGMGSGDLGRTRRAPGPGVRLIGRSLHRRASVGRRS